MTTPQDIEQYIRRAAVDPEGNRIGKVTKVYSDEKTGDPEWFLGHIDEGEEQALRQYYGA